MIDAVKEHGTMPADWPAQWEGQALEAAVAAWEASLEAQQDPFRNRQVLAQLAVHMVQSFRTEETRLFLSHAPELPSRRVKNHRLALRLRGLMQQAEQGRDLAPGIRAVLGAWRRLQQYQAPLRTGATLSH
jgi:hypothetical protein